MNREALIRRLRKYARKSGLAFEVDRKKGKGAHYIVTVGDKWTTVQSGELNPNKTERICKQLGIDPAFL